MKQIRLDALNLAILAGCSVDDVLAVAAKFARFIDTGATEADGSPTSRGAVAPPRAKRQRRNITEGVRGSG
jgi:hypothetical protein